MDTDAAGIWHHSTAIRWAEEAEAELHRELGIIEETFGATPRVHVENDFHTPLHFDDRAEIRLEATTVGESSVAYTITVNCDGRRAVTGRLVAVFIDRDTGRPRAWPPHIRDALSQTGDQVTGES